MFATFEIKKKNYVRREIHRVTDCNGRLICDKTKKSKFRMMYLYEPLSPLPTSTRKEILFRPWYSWRRGGVPCIFVFFLISIFYWWCFICSAFLLFPFILSFCVSIVLYSCKIGHQSANSACFCLSVEPRREKTGLRGFWSRSDANRLYSHRRWL